MIVLDNHRIFVPQTVVTLHPKTRVEFMQVLPLVGWVNPLDTIGWKAFWNPGEFA